jgi:hypothetical protein
MLGHGHHGAAALAENDTIGKLVHRCFRQKIRRLMRWAGSSSALRRVQNW